MRPASGSRRRSSASPCARASIEVEGHLYELVNPEIVRAAGDDRDLEGCLSIPGYVAYVTRHEKVWVVAQNRVGKKIKVAGSGLLGRALQHELDHLQGKLYIDYLDSMEELIAVGQLDDEDEETRSPLARARWREARAAGRRTRPDGLPRLAARSPSRPSRRSPRTRSSTWCAS